MAKLIIDGQAIEITDTKFEICGNKAFVGENQEIELEFEAGSIQFKIEKDKIEIFSVT